MRAKTWASLIAAAACIGIAGCHSNAPGGHTRSAGEITGAGATFPNPIYSRWFAEYGRLHPDVRINYQSVGSGAGIRQVSQGIVDFGASDGPMSDAQIAAAKVKVLHIPTVLGAVVPVYNIPGVTAELHFSPQTIADIYLENIRNWNDPRIAAENPGVALPSHAILPVYRSDGSGTTYIFTDFLCKNSPEFAQKIGRSTSVRWPVGIGQKGNEGVAGIVRNAKFSFGYVELVFAAQTHMLYGSVKNTAGNWIKASPASVTAAAAADAAIIPADYRVSITNAPGADSYPIASFTWLLIPQHWNDPAQAQQMVGFLNWMLDTGEGEAPAMNFAPLPADVAKRVRQTIVQIQ